jgi:glycosyltransferase involved in cell wall biosynthesis
MGRHMEMLAKHWSEMSLPFDRVLFAVPEPVQFEQIKSEKLAVLCLPAALPNLLWEQRHLAAAARDAALLFCPAYTCPIFYGGRLVLANHGIYEALPQEFRLIERLRATPINFASARRADHVIANSLSTKQDLIKFFGVSENKLSVVLPAASDLCWLSYTREEIAGAVIKYVGENVPYVIFVGKLAKRRHVPNLIEAFTRIKLRHALPHRLLIIGPNTSALPLDSLIATAGGETVVRYLPHAEMEPLAKLYAGADVYALPTTYEGISQTMFEAMASGTAVLTVEHPTLAEGGGDAVLAMPTASVDDLAKGLERLLTDSAYRGQLAVKAKQRASLFSWRKTSEQTMSVLDRIAAKSDRG